MSVTKLRLLYKNTGTNRLDEFLRSALPPELTVLLPGIRISNAKVRRMIIAGTIMVNGAQTRIPSFMIPRNAVIEVLFDPEKFLFEKEPDDIAFELEKDRVLFEDDYIIVVDKPAGFPSESTIVASRDNLLAAVKRYLARETEKNTGKAPKNEPYAGLLHRLDRETSGVILLTKTRTANAAVHAMFLNHTAKKEYRALTVRPKEIPPKIFSVENNLGRISPGSATAKWGAVSSGGDRAETEFRLLEDLTCALYILAVPRTGRTHQIRVHLSGLGLPILGDTLYRGPEHIDSCHIPRIMLHAESLAFPHPADGRLMSIHAPLPADFLAVQKALSY